MVSCKTTISTEDNRWVQRGNTIKNALIAHPRLETFHLICNCKTIRDVNWAEQDNRKLPPVKELVIRGLHCWTLFSVCNWSNITHLELTNVCDSALIGGLPPEELLRLKVLIIACECQDRAQRGNQLSKLSGFLKNLLSYTSHLENLALKCGVRDFDKHRRAGRVEAKSEGIHNETNDCVHAITWHCHNIRSLDLRNFDGPYSLPWKWILLSANDLRTIRHSCPGLMELSLDCKIYSYSRQLRLDMDIAIEISDFRNLRRLTVCTLMPCLPPKAGLPAHHQARAIAREWVENLQRLKKGTEFERLTVIIEIERLVTSDEFQRVDFFHWWVRLNYTCETGKAASWYVTGEERTLEFLRR